VVEAIGVIVDEVPSHCFAVPVAASPRAAAEYVDTQDRVSRRAKASSTTPNEISPSPTTKAGEYAPRLIFKRRDNTVEAAWKAMKIRVLTIMLVIEFVAIE
jgi:hypothetical protein